MFRLLPREEKFFDLFEQQAGNISAAARAVGLSRPALEYRLRKLGLFKSKRAAKTRKRRPTIPE